MHATQRGRAPYDLGLGRPVSPPRPPARKITDARTFDRSALDVEPKWLEDAVLRIVRKHGLQVPAPEPSIVEIDLDDLQFLPAPSRFWRIARAALVVVLVAASVGLVAKWRFPSQTATFINKARVEAARIGPPSAWLGALQAHLPSLHSSAAPDPIAPAPVLAPPAPTVAPMPVAPSVNAAVAPAIAPASTLASVPVTNLPVATADAPTSRSNAVNAVNAASHGARAVPKAAPVDVAPAAPKAEPKHAAHVVATVAPPAKIVDEPAPGSLADAIKRAGGGGKPAPVAEHAAIPEAKPTVDAALPDRPSASMVTSALLAVLPDARACMNDGDDAKQAVVIFESRGAVGSVQVTGANASCIQKALARAHVAPFSQATYRATVPVRPN